VIEAAVLTDDHNDVFDWRRRLTGFAITGIPEARIPETPESGHRDLRQDRTHRHLQDG
jgi:hypothetical protein